MPESGTPHVDVAMFVLGKLSAEDLAVFRTHVRRCAECQQELEALQGLPDLLAVAAPPTPVPPDLRARTVDRVRQAAAQAQRPPVSAEQVAPATAPGPASGPRRSAIVTRPRPGWWRRLWLPVAAAVAGAAVALQVSTVSVFGFLDRPEEQLYAAAVEGRSGRAEVGFTQVGENRTADVRMDDLDPAPSGSAYELWLVGPQDTEERPQRVSLGTFTPDEDGRAEFQAFTAAPADQYRAVGVTLEPIDGNPARTGPRVLAPVPSD